MLSIYGCNHKAAPIYGGGKNNKTLWFLEQVSDLSTNGWTYPQFFATYPQLAHQTRP